MKIVLEANETTYDTLRWIWSSLPDYSTFLEWMHTCETPIRGDYSARLMGNSPAAHEEWGICEKEFIKCRELHLVLKEKGVLSHNDDLWYHYVVPYTRDAGLISVIVDDEEPVKGDGYYPLKYFMLSIKDSKAMRFKYISDSIVHIYSSSLGHLSGDMKGLQKVHDRCLEICIGKPLDLITEEDVLENNHRFAMPNC